MFPFKSASNCSIVCPSTPAAPLLDLTALYASYTRRLTIVNGLSVVSVDVILSPVVSLHATTFPDPFAPAPLQGLHHYYGSIRPSPLHRYSRLAVFAACASPFPSGAGSCSSAQKPMSDSRPLYAGRRPPSHQAPGGLVPEEIHAPGFDDACFLTTRLRRVHCHSSFGHSPAQGPALSFWSNAHHHAFWTQQLGVV